MQTVERALGDKAWFADGRKGLVEGKVVHLFEMYGMAQYVIEVETHIDPYLVVRSGMTVSDAPDKPIGIWRR